MSKSIHRGSFLFSCLYSVAIFFLALFSLPKIIKRYFKQGKELNAINHRLGIGLKELFKDKKGGIWIHAVSFGEVKAILPLFKVLEKNYPKLPFVVSCMTETGYAEAKKVFPKAAVLFMPVDFKWIVNRAVKLAEPKLVILSETDYWYHFLLSAKQAGASVVVASGKISHRSLNSFRRFPLFAKKLFDLVDLICLQNDAYRKRFLELPIAEEKLVVTGSLKYDTAYPVQEEEKRKTWRDEHGIAQEDLLVVLGSTHAPEEEMLLKALTPLLAKHPTLKLMIVPRHPQRFDVVEALLEKTGVPYLRSTRASKGESASILILDRMGQLCKAYEECCLAVVCGSFTDKVGGHNILEPLAYGKPVLFGPHMYTQFELKELVLGKQAGLEVTELTVGAVIDRLLQNKKERESMGQKGLQLIEEQQGTAKRTLDAIKPLLDK